MSNKFTGITSAGSAIPVYDKDAHEALGQKLDTSAFSSVSGDFLTEVPESAVSGFATHEEVESATSGKADTSAAVPVVDSLSTLVNNTDYIGLAADRDGNFYQVVARSGEPQSAWVVTYTKDSITRAVHSENRTGPWQSWHISPSYIEFPHIGTVSQNGFSLYGIVDANTGGLSANGLSAGKAGPIYIQGQTEIMSAGGLAGFTFSSQNTGFGSAQLTTAYGNQIVQMYSPKFEAKNVSGAGFSIEASGAKGYDHNGNVTWDTTNPPSPSQLVAGSDSPKPNILLSPYMPKSLSAQFSSAPLFSADGNGLYIGISGQSLKAQMQGLTAKNGSIRAEYDNSSGYSFLTGHDVSVVHTSAWGSANSGTWSLTGSVQKREIECDSATSAITAIAGSAIGGGGELPSGVMVESAFEFNSSDRITGYNGSAFAQGGGADLDFGYDESGAISSINTSAISDSRAGTSLYVESPLFTGQSGNSAYIGSDINETVLWTGTGSTTGSTINLNESLTHFERYGLYYYIPYQETNQTYYQELVYKPGQTVFGIKTDGINSTLWRQYIDYGTMTDTSISLVSGRQGGFWLTGTDRAFNLYDGSERHHYFTKIVGINRKRV